MAKVDLTPDVTYVVECREYPGDAESLAVFERAHATMKEVSLWRTATPDRARWFLLSCWKSPHADMDEFDWADGVEVELQPAQVKWAIERRLGRGALAAMTGAPELNERIKWDGAIRIPGGS